MENFMISTEDMYKIIIAILAVGGFFVAKHIRDHKKKKTKLVCPMRFDCNAVVHSDYSKFLGLPVEFFGMAYYALIALGYLGIVVFRLPLSFFLDSVLVLLSFGAFIFSLYLVGVQAFVLKKGCTWCLASAIISSLIFLLTILSHEFMGFILL